MSGKRHVKIVVGEGASVVSKLGDATGDSPINLVIANGVVEIKEFAFRFCRRIATVTFPDTLKTIGMYAFDECSNLHSITFSDSVQKIGMHAFNGCTQLEKVILPRDLKSIDSWLFSHCDNLRTVVMPKGLETIGKESFRGCRALSKVILPESLVRIGDCAFKGCRKLVGIKIPTSVQFIGEDAVPQPKKPVGTWSAEERQLHLARLVKKRENVVSAIQKDAVIPITKFTEKVQKLAAECGMTADDAVSYKHTDSYVMCCPCAMQFPALTRVAVKVPRSLLKENEPDCFVGYLDEDRNKDWFAITIGENGSVLEVYPSLKETKMSRFGKMFSLVSLAKNENK